MKRAPKTVSMDPGRTLQLERFLPHQLALLADTIGKSMAMACAERFGLTTSEWRVITVLAHAPGLSATELAERAALDKVATSRALTTLVAARRVERAIEESDRRRSQLRLTSRGTAIFNELAPLALRYEDAVLQALPVRLRREMNFILDALQRRAASVRINRLEPELKAPPRRMHSNTGN